MVMETLTSFYQYCFQFNQFESERALVLICKGHALENRIVPVCMTEIILHLVDPLFKNTFLIPIIMYEQNHYCYFRMFCALFTYFIIALHI